MSRAILIVLLMAMLFAAGLIVAGFFFFTGGNEPGPATTPSPAPAPAPSCASDWTVCKDNADMANNFRGWSNIPFACKLAAEDRAKYGSPKWPWFAFGSFLPGDDYRSGKVTLIERDAQFQNGFGAMVHSRVICKYDMKEKTVLDVTISER